MGFFSSKKTVDHQVSESSMDSSDKSVVQTIRSRFYGKSKGKEREVISPPVISSPRSPNGARMDEKLLPINNNVRPHGSNSRAAERGPASKSAPSSSSRSADPITVTLASRLNELAVSNREGLLNDEEYRLLRQNLFERFASGEVAPSEKSHVPLSRPNRNSMDSRPSTSQGRPPSQFHVNPSRTPSLHTKTSMASTVSTIFRRASRRVSSGMQDSSVASDASSIFSMTSARSNVFRRPALGRKTSDTSIRTEVSRPYEPSYSSMPNSATDQSLSPAWSMSRSTTRSLRRLATATPPSSFPGRLPSADAGSKPPPPAHLQDVFNDENLQTAQEIRRAIELVDAEGRRLMDAFNGLELTTLTRRRQQPARLQPATTQLSDGSRSNNGDPSNSLSPERKRRDMDVLSIRSTTSVGTTLSVARSQHSRRIQGANKSVSLLRKNSISSVSSSTRAGSVHGLHPVPPLPTPPSLLGHLGHLGVGSTSSISLARSGGGLHHLSALAESEIVDRRSFAEARPGPGSDQEDAEITALESELNDIRKRRGEVTARYETRLEYLRAKLKGAELHEKLLRK